MSMEDTPLSGNGPAAAGNAQAAANAEAWSDVLFVEQPEPTLSFRTGWTVYEESLTNGQYVGRGWNGSGYISFYDGRLNPAEHATPQAFWLEIDGQWLGSDWQWAGYEKLPAPKAAGPAGLHTVVTLRHALRPITVRVHTQLDGTPVLTRWLEVTNTGQQPAALSAGCSWSGVLQKTPRSAFAHRRQRPATLFGGLLRQPSLGLRRRLPVAGSAGGRLSHRRPLPARPSPPPLVRRAQQRHRRALHRAAGLVGRL